MLDDEFIYGDPGGQAVLKVSVPNADDVQVAPPPASDVWVDSPDYAADGQSVAGNGGDLSLPLSAQADDLLVRIQATKVHQIGDQTRQSAVPLTQALLVLVEPNPAPPLRLRVGLDGQQTDGTLEAFDGQPGVFYTFQAAAQAVGLPAYFHQRDAISPTLNKGLNQLRISVDFVVERSYTVLDSAQTPPDPPLIATSPLAFGTSLSVQATKARTRVGISLPATYNLVAPPAVQVTPALVDFNTAAKIGVSASVIGESYQPLIGDQPLANAQTGTGQDLAFDTAALTQDTNFALLITQPGSNPATVELLLRLSVRVRPDATVAVRLLNDPVTPGTAAQFQIDASQAGISYQLMANSAAVGAVVVGTGSPVKLTSDPISADTTFVVHATRVDQPDIAVDLTPPITANIAVVAPPPA